IDYADRMEVARKSDQEAWYRRLRERKIDTVVLFPPNPPEYDWVISRPDRFAPEDTASLPMVFRVLAAK
ncbi:hypothetical protein KBA41_07740, partial [Candidatus Ozemobacteraceae bacterium]|nr:hypothetical protein [Candidatus Ozemobacteraceae bacterium]